MKVYMDELPKDCIGCPCESEYYCNLLNEDIGFLKWGEVHHNCPLQSLSDYTKQVRNELKQKIWKEFEQRLMNKTEDMPVMKVANMINSVLDQIQGE